MAGALSPAAAAGTLNPGALPAGETILISGASGLVGRALANAIGARGGEVVRLVRPAAAAGGDRRSHGRGDGGAGAGAKSKAGTAAGAGAEIEWRPRTTDGALPVAVEALPRVAAAVCLSGANLAAQPWTRAYKREILESRVAPARAMCRLLAALETRPRVLVCASATGVYGDRGDQLLDEDSAAGSGFLADVCRQWEQACAQAESAGIRVVNVRFGMILSAAGGALRKMLPVFRAGLGGRLGSGRQWMSWVTLEDAVEAILFAIENESLRGPVNVVSPWPATNAEWTEALGRVLGRPALLRVPGALLRLAMGEMAKATVLASTRALPARLERAGFSFRNPELEGALRAILRPPA